MAEKTDVSTFLGGENFIVADSGHREEYTNGFVRDTEDGKTDLVWLFGNHSLDLLPQEMVERWLSHMEKGAQKYGRNNWERAEGATAVARFRRSAVRHLNQWLAGDNLEDHASAIVFNVWAAEVTAAKLSEMGGGDAS